jgi:large repetitive protein
MRLRYIGILSVLATLLAVFAGVARALDFDDEDPHPPRAEIGLLYHYEIGTHAGCIPHHVSILSGELPPGLKLTQIGYQTALVDGLATEAGTFSAWLAVRDCDNRSAETLFTFEVWDRRFGIDTKALPAGSAGSSYSFTLATWGIPSNTTWAVTNGTLPAGLALSKEGVISGTPTGVGSSTFTIEATGVAKDFTGTRVDSRQYTLNVTALAASLSRPVAEVGVPLHTALVASGGQAPYTWSAGSAPAGLTVGSDGTLSGVPAKSGAYTLTVHLVDADGAAKDLTVRLVVRARLAIATKALRSGTAGHAYRAKLATRGGVAPLRWAASLPRGLKLSRTGMIIGAPAAAGTFRVKVRVRDSLGATSTKTLLLRVR